MSFSDYLQTQPLLRVAIAMMAGIVVGDALWNSIPIWAWLTIVAACLIAELVLKNKPYAQSFILLLAIFFAGATLITKADNDCSFPFQEGETVEYEAVITGEPQVRGKVLRCDLAITSVNGKKPGSPISIKASVLRDTIANYWKVLHVGSGIKAQSAMQRPANYYHDSNFDYVRWLHGHGFRARTFIYYTDWQQANVSLASLSATERLRLKALKLRHKLIKQLHNGNEDQQSAVVAAMVLGDKHALSNKTKNAYSVSGASHILALSGLHLGIIFTILTLLFGKSHRYRWLSQALIIIAIWTFVVLVGIGTSVVRSAVMLTIYSLCLVAGRETASVNSLSLAAIIMLVANPLCLWDVGFQMSFMAVLAIVVLYRRIYRLMPKNGNIFKINFLNSLLKTAWSMAVVSLAAQIGTAPLVAYYFGRFSNYFLLSNYIVIPCATIIIYCALLTLISAPLPLLNGIAMQLLNHVSNFLNSSVSWLASLPGASIDNIHISTIQVFCIYTAIAVICLFLTYLKSIKSLTKLDAFR